MGRVINGVYDCVCVCELCVHALKGKWLELSTQNFVDIQYMAVTWHVFTPSSTVKGKGHVVISVLLAWVYMPTGLLRFSVYLDDVYRVVNSKSLLGSLCECWTGGCQR